MAKKRGNGEGNIRQRKDGAWEARATVRRQLNGTPERVSLYGKTRKEVATKLTNFLNDYENGTLPNPRALTLGQWLDEWMAQYKKNQLKPTTYVSYSNHINNHIKPFFGTCQLADLHSLHMQKFVNELSSKGLSPASVYSVIKVLKCAIKKAYRTDLIQKEVTQGLDLPKGEKAPRKPFTVEQQEAFIEIAKTTQHGNVFIFGLFTGMRIGELLGLRWQDINIEEKYLRVNMALNYVKDVDDPNSRWRRELDKPKTQSSRRDIPLKPAAIKLLRAIKLEQTELRLKLGTGYEDSNAVFATKFGKTLDRNNMQRIFKRICAQADMEGFSIHNLRHTFASLSHAQGMDIKILQEILGHASITETADTYTHLTIDTKRQAMEKLIMPAI